MGGKGSGRRRKPTPILKLQGQYRSDRHGDRADAELSTGSPVKPDGLPPFASAMWDHVVKAVHSDLLAEADTACLEGMAHWYSVWRSNITSVDASELRTAAAAWDRFAALTIRFGMSPVDRTKIKLQAKDNKPRDPMEELLG
jgi:phage terminase small subunit